MALGVVFQPWPRSAMAAIAQASSALMAAVASCSFKGDGKCKAAPSGEDESKETCRTWLRIPAGSSFPQKPSKSAKASFAPETME